MSQTDSDTPRALVAVHCRCGAEDEDHLLVAVVDGAGLMLLRISAEETQTGDHRVRCPSCRTFTFLRAIVAAA